MKTTTLIILAATSLLTISCASIKDSLKQSIAETLNHSSTESNTINYDELSWCWGGFNGSGAVETSSAQISNLSVSMNGMSYSWSTGGCEQLGASNRTDASQTLACLFCLIDGEWRGGKFDWISTHRLTRDFHNIETSYHGWDASAISKASAYRFVIVSKDGKTRTNVIEVTK